MLLTECFWIKRLAPTTACQCVQGPGQGAIYNTISHTRRGYRHQNCSRLIILNGYRERATLRTAFSLALNQEGRGREGWAKCTAKANGKSKIIVFAFFIIQRERIDGGRERGRGEQPRVSEDMLREKGGTATVIRKKKIFLLLQEKQFHIERWHFIYSYFLVHWLFLYVLDMITGCRWCKGNLAASLWQKRQRRCGHMTVSNGSTASIVLRAPLAHTDLAVVKQLYHSDRSVYFPVDGVLTEFARRHAKSFGECSPLYFGVSKEFRRSFADFSTCWTCWSRGFGGLWSDV